MMPKDGGDCSCFVTVGTTSFDSLVEIVSSSDEVHGALRSLGITRLVLQIGRGGVEPPSDTTLKPSKDNGKRLLPVEWFRFAPTLEEHMQSAALVISHGGAGSIMEALANKKPLVVVTNDALMDNHQEELACALDIRGHLRSTTCQGLANALRDISLEVPSQFFKPYPQPDKSAFPKLVDATCGF